MIIIWVILCIVIGSIGKDRKIGFGGAFIASLLLSPVIGLIITLVSDKKGEKQYDRFHVETQAEKRERVKKENKDKPVKGMTGKPIK